MKKNSILYSIIGKTSPGGASAHHPGIRDPGGGLSISAVAPDGLPEGIEDADRPDSFIAVQWHPEVMVGDKDQLKLFRWVCQRAA